MPGTQLPRGSAVAPCDWPVSYAGCTAVPFSDESDQAQAAEDRATFESIATAYLWEWTGRRYGLCAETIRPRRERCSGRSSYLGTPLAALWSPQLVPASGAAYGAWLPVELSLGILGALGCGTCGMGAGCRCLRSFSVRLPGPVASVTSVTIDGTALDPGAYRLDGSQLVRTDGGWWPDDQDVALPPTQPGTWQVAYSRGLEVPVGGQVAAGVLATELAKAACGDSSCQLPQRVQTITRQGVTMALLDDFKNSLDHGYTGIWVVDSWISSVMVPQPSAIVTSPDYRPGREGR